MKRKKSLAIWSAAMVLMFAFVFAFAGRFLAYQVHISRDSEYTKKAEKYMYFLYNESGNL